jgi:hypothetical protein
VGLEPSSLRNLSRPFEFLGENEKTKISFRIRGSRSLQPHQSTLQKGANEKYKQKERKEKKEIHIPHLNLAAHEESCDTNPQKKVGASKQNQKKKNRNRWVVCSCDTKVKRRKQRNNRTKGKTTSKKKKKKKKMAYSSYDEETGQYIDFVQHISDLPFFFPDMTRESAEEFLSNAPDNCCVIRPKLSNCCVLSHKEKGRIKHALLYKSGGRGGGYYLEKTTRTFPTIEQMLTTYELIPYCRPQSDPSPKKDAGYAPPAIALETYSGTTSSAPVSPSKVPPAPFVAAPTSSPSPLSSPSPSNNTQNFATFIPSVPDSSREEERIFQFLTTLDLVKYFENFKKAEITVEVLESLRDKDLSELGLPLGPRKKILAAIQAKKHLE